MVGDTSSADDVAAAFAKGTWRNNWSCVVFDEGCDTVFTHLILDKLWEGFIYVALKRAPICNLILFDLFVQQQPVNGSRWGGSMWARCSVHVDSCRFNQKGNRKRGIGIFNQFSYIYHRVLFWKGFPISMDKLLHQLVMVNTRENAAIISCNDGIFMDLLYQPVFSGILPIRSKAWQRPSFLISHGQKLLRHHGASLRKLFFLNLKRERVTQNADYEGARSGPADCHWISAAEVLDRLGKRKGWGKSL